jgi:hypothetical protein
MITVNVPMMNAILLLDVNTLM